MSVRGFSSSSRLLSGEMLGVVINGLPVTSPPPVEHLPVMKRVVYLLRAYLTRIPPSPSRFYLDLRARTKPICWGDKSLKTVRRHVISLVITTVHGMIRKIPGFQYVNFIAIPTTLSRYNRPDFSNNFQQRFDQMRIRTIFATE